MYRTVPKPNVDRAPKTTSDKTRQDETRTDQIRQDKTRQDQTRPDLARQDQTRPDQTRQDQTRPDKTRQDQTRPGQARPGQARPDRTRHSSTRLSLIVLFVIGRGGQRLLEMVPFVVPLVCVVAAAILDFDPQEESEKPLAQFINVRDSFRSVCLLRQKRHKTKIKTNDKWHMTKDKRRRQMTNDK
jgi:hypothetical protein